MFLAVEMLHLVPRVRAGTIGALWALIPLFLLWANWDTSFLTGLLVLAAAAVGRWLDGEHRRAGSSRPLGIAGPLRGWERLRSWRFATPRAAVGGERPSSSWGSAPPLAWSIPGLTSRTSRPSSPSSNCSSPNEGIPGGVLHSLAARADGDGLVSACPSSYLILVAIGIGSFWLNAPRFSWSRFLPFAVVSILWGVMMRYSAEFAIVFAAVMALNGQEWYQARFGTEGRLGRGCGALVDRRPPGDPDSALPRRSARTSPGGITHLMAIGSAWDTSSDDFPFEAADFLEQTKEIKGNVLNTSPAQGDVLVWKASPKRKDLPRQPLGPVPAHPDRRVAQDPQGPQRGRRRDLEADAGSIQDQRRDDRAGRHRRRPITSYSRVPTGSPSTTTAGSSCSAGRTPILGPGRLQGQSARTRSRVPR